MNIIIPLCGKGERFKNNNYSAPKPLIKIFDKEMIFYVLDNLSVHECDKLFIIINHNLEKYNFEKIVNKKYPNVNFIKLNKQTSGASETIKIGLELIMEISTNKKCMLLDCDTFYTKNVVDIYRSCANNAVFYTHNDEENPIYSYIKLNEQNFVTEIIEKNKISRNANTGIYCFNDINELYNYSTKVVNNNINFNGECYTSCIIDTMIKDNKIFEGIELNKDNVYNLGTPKQICDYVNNTYLFLFDLDGTLVVTDDIYFNVWKTILKDYKIELTKDIFEKNIQGNSDVTALSCILPNKYKDLLDDISALKDKLFLENIEKIKVISGINHFLELIKKLGHKIAIVTNCNRKVAEEILIHIDIYKFIDKLTIGNECTRTKPYPDPYLETINCFCSSNDRTIIFEDSKTGIQSGKNVFPKCLIGVETIYNKDELINNGVNFSIKNYDNLDINTFINYNNANVDKIKKYIKTSLANIDIKDIEILDHKLKGGFISDVIGVKIHTDKEVIDCVLKLENKNETFLSKMANDLGLYEREYYFYDNFSKYVPVKTPAFYGIIKDDCFNNIGILMKNLINLDYKLNLDLNKEKIDVSLKIIERLAQMHAKFWNKNLQKKFKELKKHDDKMFNPAWDNFIKNKWSHFKTKWSSILTEEQLNKAEDIVNNFQSIQHKLSDKNLTFCHGDVKSANIFYQPLNDNYEPYFIDWQYICEGKGVQDLVFFMIESFEINTINQYKRIFKDYYYVKLIENGVQDYNLNEYNEDFKNAIHYFPFFVAIWFGTINDDELIDKNFPLFFIQRLFNFI